LFDVIATDVENVWLVNLIFFTGFRPPLNRSFNMKFGRAILRFITKNELYGFIILYKTIINVINIYNEWSGNSIGIAMVSVLTSSVVDRVFDHR
jgi:hypothetical protein